MALDRWQNLISYCDHHAIVRPATLTHEVQQRLMLSGRSTWSRDGSQRLDALAFHGHQQTETVIPKWPSPIRMPQSCRQSLDIGRKPVFTLGRHDPLQPRDGSELGHVIESPTRPCDSVRIGLVDPHRPRCSDAVGVQDQHDLAHDLLLGRLKALGWGSKRIAAELGCSRNTVNRWLQHGDWRPCASPSRSRRLDGLADWLADRFRRHSGNADVIRQELAEEKGVHVSLRTVERAVAPLRRELVAATRATVRFETRPGEQLQTDFGERRVEIGGVVTKVFFFVATLGYSRRLFVRAFAHEKQESWFAGMEDALQAFGGIPREVLLDNARALILHHDPASREVVLHPKLHAFAKHWGRCSASARWRAGTSGAST